VRYVYYTVAAYILFHIIAFICIAVKDQVQAKRSVRKNTIQAPESLKEFILTGTPDWLVADPEIAIRYLGADVHNTWLSLIEPRWRKSSVYPPDWKWRRRYVFIRDDGRCQACNSELKKYDCHHVKPLRSGGDNSLNNLVTLCAECHSLQHPNNWRLRRRANRRWRRTR